MMRNQTGPQTVLVVAMGLVTTATAVALHQHGGVPAPVATTAALAVFFLLVTGHALAWRRERHARENSSSRDRREQELRRLKDGGRQDRDGRRDQGAAIQHPARGPQPGRAPAAGAQRASGPAAQKKPAGARAAERASPPPLPSAGPAPGAGRAGPSEADHAEDFWSFRPAPQGRDDLPPFVTGRVSAAVGGSDAALSELGHPPKRNPSPSPAAPTATRGPEQRAATPREADVEVIQDAIKRLLEEVNAAEQEDARGSAPALSIPEAGVDQAIDALRMTAGTMRSAAAGPRDGSPGVASSHASPHNARPHEPQLPPFVRGAAPPRPASPADSRARLMADAISAGRIDVTLEPILGLEDQQTRHYEVSVRLRDSEGHVLEVSPEGPDLRGTGLLPLFDGVRVTRTAAVARRLEERGKVGSVFSAFSGESVADEHFLGELAETLHHRAGLATQLVLTFTQSDVRGFSTPEWDSLADMRALGFRFALSHITDLDMDFEVLAEQGFAFVKLDASVFLEGLPAPSGHLPSSDVCRHLAKHGLTLVVEHIDDDEKLARVFGFGVLLGQGQLFGGPRPVRADVTRNRNATAA